MHFPQDLTLEKLKCFILSDLGAKKGLKDLP